MKVKCINRGYWVFLTLGKIYNVIWVGNSHYNIIDDNGVENWYRKEWVEPAISEMINDKIDKILEDES